MDNDETEPGYKSTHSFVLKTFLNPDDLKFTSVVMDVNSLSGDQEWVSTFPMIHSDVSL